METEEVIEVIDAKNNTLGRAKRGEVHKKGLLHRAVNVTVRNPQGQIYLQQRSKQKLSFPLHWDLSCAEHLKPGETFTEAAVRGLKEELGINIDALKLIRPLHHQYSKFQKDGQLMKENELVELYESVYDHRMKLDKQEVAQGKFFPISTIKKMLKSKKVKFTPWFLDEWSFLKE